MKPSTDFSELGFKRYNQMMGIGWVQAEYGNLSRAARENFKSMRAALDFLCDVQDYLIVSLSDNPRPHYRALLHKRARRVGINAQLTKFLNTAQALRPIVHVGPYDKRTCELTGLRSMYPF